jgi:hypothetical protein
MTSLKFAFFSPFNIKKNYVPSYCGLKYYNCWYSLQLHVAHTHAHIYHSNYIFFKPQVWNKEESKILLNLYHSNYIFSNLKFGIKKKVKFSNLLKIYNKFFKNIFYLSKLKLMWTNFCLSFHVEDYP